MYRDRVVEAGPCQGILHNDTDISGLDGLRSILCAMCLEDEVVTGIPFLEATEHGELLLGNRHTPVQGRRSIIMTRLLANPQYHISGFLVPSTHFSLACQSDLQFAFLEFH